LEAIKRIKEKKARQCGCWYKMIFMDIYMPVMNGLESSKIIRSMMNKFEIHPCPIIGCSAEGPLSGPEREEYFTNGITDIRKL
jgi:CheY-like chemotaxis protein